MDGVATLDEAELRSLVPDWLDLWHRVRGLVFQHPAWAMTVPAPGRRIGFAVRAHGALRGLLVLSIHPEGLRFAGHPLNDGNEVLTCDADVRSALVRSAAAGAERGGLRLEFLEHAGPTMSTLEEDLGLHVQWRDPEPCPVLPVGARPSSRLDRRLQQERDRLGRSLTVDHIVPTYEDVLAFVTRRLETWSERGRIEELAPTERHPTFPSALARSCAVLAEHGLCSVARLAINGCVVAEDLYLGDRRRPLLYMRRYERCSGLVSPGLQLATAVRQSAHLGPIDLGRGDEPYKTRLGAHHRSVWTADVILDDGA